MPTPRLPSRVDAARLAVRRGVLRRRRLLSALCAVAAVLAVVRAVTPPPPETVTVIAAARDLPSGTVLAADDLLRLTLPDSAVPDGAVASSDAVGRTVAAPVRRGEPLTDARLVGPGLLAGYPGLVAVPVRVPDAGAVALLRVGDRIDLVVADPAGGRSGRVADDVPVVALPAASDSAGAGLTAGQGGRLVVVAAPEAEAAEIAESAVRGFVSLTLSR